MGEFLMKILGFIIGAGILLGIIGFCLWMLSIIFSRNPFGGLYLPWMPWLGGGCHYTIKGKITINGKDEAPQGASTNYDTMSQPLCIVPHNSADKPMKSVMNGARISRVKG